MSISINQETVETVRNNVEKKYFSSSHSHDPMLNIYGFEYKNTAVRMQGNHQLYGNQNPFFESILMNDFAEHVSLAFHMAQLQGVLYANFIHTSGPIW